MMFVTRFLKNSISIEMHQNWIVLKKISWKIEKNNKNCLQWECFYNKNIHDEKALRLKNENVTNMIDNWWIKKKQHTWRLNEIKLRWHFDEHNFFNIVNCVHCVHFIICELNVKNEIFDEKCSCRCSMILFDEIIN